MRVPGLTWSALRRRGLPLAAAALVMLLAVWLVLAPAEKHLGNLVKLIYLHGALVWAGLITFSLAGALALVALVTRKPAWHRGTLAAGRAALIVWILYALSAMAVTGLAWGQVVAWNEPRVRVTALILGAAVLLELVIRLVDHPAFASIVRLVMGVAPWIAVAQADAIRHPVDPIGGSGSVAIRTYYSLIVTSVAGLAGVLALWLWAGLELRSRAAAAIVRGAELREPRAPGAD